MGATELDTLRIALRDAQAALTAADAALETAAKTQRVAAQAAVAAQKTLWDYLNSTAPIALA